MHQLKGAIILVLSLPDQVEIRLDKLTKSAGRIKENQAQIHQKIPFTAIFNHMSSKCYERDPFLSKKIESAAFLRLLNQE